LDKSVWKIPLESKLWLCYYSLIDDTGGEIMGAEDIMEPNGLEVSLSLEKE